MKSKIINRIIFLIIILISFTPLIYRKILFFSYESEKGFYFRLLVEIAIGLWLILMLKDSSFKPRRTPINIIILYIATVLFIVDIIGVDSSLSYFSNFERMAGLLMYLTVFAYYFLITSIVNTQKRWLIFGISLTVVSFIVAIYGIYKNGNEEVYGGRAVSTLGNPNQLAIYLLFGIFTLPIIYKSIALRINTSRTYIKNLLLCISIIFTSVYLICLYKTATRGVIFSFLISLIILLFFLFWHKKIVLKKIYYILIVFGFTLSLLIHKNQSENSRFNYTTFSRLTNFNKINGSNTFKDRLDNYKIALNGIKEKPFFGWGQENYHYVFAKYYNPNLYENNIWYDRSHNILLDWLLTGGLFGLTAYLLLWAIILYQLWFKAILSFETKLFLTAFALAYFFSILSFFDSLITLMSFMTVVAFINYNIPILQKDKFSKPYDLKYKNKFSFIGIFITIISIIYFTVLQPLKANLSIAAAFKASSLNEVVAHYVYAYRNSNLGKLEIAEQLGNLSEQVIASDLDFQTKQNYFQKTTEILDIELQKRPNYSRLLILKGNILNATGNSIEAENVFESVQKLAPNRQENLMQLANILVKNNKSQRALKIIETAFLLDTNNTDLKVKLAFFYSINGDTTSRNRLINQLDNRYFCNNIELIQKAFELTSDNKNFYQSCFEKLIGNVNTVPKAYLLWAVKAYQDKNYEQASIAVYAFRRHFNNEKLFVDKRFPEVISQDVLNGLNPEIAFKFIENSF